jgi:processive 1,2-diacylglycerol beta-glucosyltransferase
MAQLVDKATGGTLGRISEADLQFLKAHLEEEGLGDQDYYINRDTVEHLEGTGAPATLLDLLRQALGEREEIEIKWSPE